MRISIFSFIVVGILLTGGCKDGVQSTIDLRDITVTPQAINLSIGDTQQITATPVPADADPGEMPFICESSNTKIASVSSSGLVKALSTGTTTIRVSGRINNKIYKTVSVTVSKETIPLTAISVSPETLSI